MRSGAGCMFSIVSSELHYDSAMKWSIAFLAVLLLLHIGLYVFIGEPSSLALAGNIFQGMALLFAAILFTRVARHSKKEEMVIKNLLALAFWVFLMSHAMLSYSELLLKQPATGTVTDAIWLIGYGLIIRALYLLLKISAPIAEARKQLLAQTLIILLVVCSALWNIISDPDATVLIRIINPLFPILDFMIAGLAFQVARESHDSRWFIGASASTIIGIADLVYPYFDSLTSPVFRYLDVPLFVGYSLWALQAAAFEKKQTIAAG